MNMTLPVPRLYRRLLGLYPAAFRREFADEMGSVFDLAWASQDDNGQPVAFCLRELFGLLWGAAREHRDSPRTATDQARLITRLTSLLLGIFYLAVTLTGDVNNSYTALLMVVFSLILTVGALIACRWERTGGIVMLTSAVTISTILMLVALELGGVWILLILPGALLFPLPFGLLGAMFTVLGQRAHSAA